MQREHHQLVVAAAEGLRELLNQASAEVEVHRRLAWEVVAEELLVHPYLALAVVEERQNLALVGVAVGEQRVRRMCSRELSLASVALEGQLEEVVES